MIRFDPALTGGGAPAGKRGRQPDGRDAAIRTCLTMKVLSGMAPGPTTGFAGSLLHLIGLDRAVPDFSTLSRRQKTLKAIPPYRANPRHPSPAAERCGGICAGRGQDQQQGRVR